MSLQLNYSPNLGLMCFTAVFFTKIFCTVSVPVSPFGVTAILPFYTTPSCLNNYKDLKNIAHKIFCLDVDCGNNATG